MGVVICKFRLCGWGILENLRLVKPLGINLSLGSEVTDDTSSMLDINHDNCAPTLCICRRVTN